MMPAPVRAASFARYPALSGGVLLLAACGPAGEPEPPPWMQTPAVSVARPEVRQITDWDEYTGRLAAVGEVEVRARVSGYLDRVAFTDGAMVEAGDLLYVIDPRPFQAALAEEQAGRERAAALLALARNDEARAERLYKSRSISEEELDNRRQGARQAQANLAAAEAAVEQARLNFEFTEVRAPIRGRISRTRVTPGNLINGGTADATLLTTIVSLDPIHLYFTGSESAYLRYVRLDQSGARRSSRDAPNPVLLQLADEAGFPHEGHMDFVDNRIDPATGTMQGRAIFPNPDGVLIPGLFARVRLLGEGPYPALLVPDAAIATDQNQRFVYVLGAADVAERRNVTPGRLVDGLRVIREGLDGDEWVIVNGLQRVRAGQPVKAERRATEVVPSETPAGETDSAQ